MKSLQNVQANKWDTVSVAALIMLDVLIITWKEQIEAFVFWNERYHGFVWIKETFMTPVVKNKFSCQNSGNVTNKTSTPPYVLN